MTHLGAMYKLGQEYYKRLDPDYMRNLEEYEQNEKISKIRL